MTVSKYFKNFNAQNEQDLIENLIIESIKIHGIDVYYLPKTLVAYDKLYGEDPMMEFNQAIPIEMYIKNVDSFGGDGSFLSKFNIEIRDQVVLTVSRKRFGQDVGGPANILRPNEGDLLWFPLNNKIFRLYYADEKAIFFQFGKLQTYDLTLELYEYSNERFNTGIAQIDAIEMTYSTGTAIHGLSTDDDFVLADSKGYPLVNSEYLADEKWDPFSDNEVIQQEAEEFLDFSEANPFGERNF